MRQRRVRGASDATVARKHRPDYVLLLASLFVTVVGVVVMYSISPAVSALSGGDGTYYFSRHLLAFAIGLVASIIFAQLSLTWLRRLLLPFTVLSLVSAGIVLALEGVAFRWVKIAGFSFQPAEMIKFTLILWLAFFLSERMQAAEIGRFHKTLKPVLIVMAIIASVIVILQRDLGSMVVLTAIAGAMLFVANVPLRPLLIGFLVVLSLGAIAVASTPYRRDRFETFLNPERDCQNEGYHACQALIAVGSGGLLGLGIGNSVQAYGYLPETPTDSIFAVYAEKFGFVGCVLLIAVYGLIIQRMIRIMQRTQDSASRLIVVGVLTWFGVQSFINLGAMLGLLPLKGITLPLISYGGSSLIFVMISLAVVYRISYYTGARRLRVFNDESQKIGDHEGIVDRRRDRRTHYSTISGR